MDALLITFICPVCTREYEGVAVESALDRFDATGWCSMWCELENPMAVERPGGSHESR